MSQQHTPEPWWNDGGTVIKAKDNIPAQATSEEDARRIVACVNACAGIPTQDLVRVEYEITPVFELLIQATKQRDELLAALDRLTFAAQCRDNTSGDACRLIEVKAELAAASASATSVIARAKEYG